MDALRKLFGVKKKQPEHTYDEAQTQPLDALALARALNAEGRRHVAVGAFNYAHDASAFGSDAHCILVGNSDGLNALPDFAVFGVAEAAQGEAEVSRSALYGFAHHLIAGAILDLLAVDGGAEARSFERAVEQGFAHTAEVMAQRHPGSDWSMSAGMMFADIIVIGLKGKIEPYYINQSRIGTLKSNGQVFSDPAGDEVQILSQPVPRDGYLFIGTQGLFQAISSETIRRTVLESANPQAACDAIKAKVEEQAQVQRATAVLFHYPLDFDAWR